MSHSTNEVARLADRLVLLEDGRIRAMGAIGAMLTRLDPPLVQDDQAEVIIRAIVAAHDDEFDLTYFDFPGGRFTVPRKALPIGHPSGLRVAARDVSLTLQAQTGTSILNIFKATVEEIIPEAGVQVTVRLAAGDSAGVWRRF